MKIRRNRREVLMTLGMATSAAVIAGGAVEAAPQSSGGGLLKALLEQTERASGRRDFKTVPMILTERSQWDAEAIDLLIAYRGDPKQVWDQTEIDGPWLNLMRNSLNAQIWSFCHPDFLVVSATHGSAHLALFDQAIWEKYRLSDMTNGKMASNTLIHDASTSLSDDYEDPTGPYSAAGNSIPALRRRGVIFLGCHNAIWEISGKLIKAAINPDHLSQDAMAAELTNHLLPGTLLSPGAVATIPELQRAGFFYIK
jgi:hypothetical protein